MTTTEEKIKKIFCLEDSLKVEKVKKLRDFAFVHYKSREDAEEALEKLNNIDIDGSIVEVTWAKPADRITRPRCHSRPSQHMIHDVPGMAPFLYSPPGYDAYNTPVPFPNCPGRGSFMPRGSLRNRVRGAAGVRPFRSYGLSANRPIAYKPSESGTSQGVGQLNPGPEPHHNGVIVSF
ncbi:RNA-binding protein 47 [Trichonephila clavipes]|nr:RNA-binding protein 47 [Trichonephila clavipes]